MISLGLPISIVLIGCSSGKSTPGSSTVSFTKPAPPVKAAPVPVVKKRVSNRKANVSGTVLILEYHQFKPKETRYARSIGNFRKDLELLYKNGYRPVTMTEYLNNRMDLAPGASPVILTFDDSDITQFKMMPDGSIDPNSGVGIWKAFADQHPDFPVKGSWYILPKYPWWQKSFYKQKIRMLKDWGSDFGSHSWSHPNFSRLSDEQVQEQLGKSFDWLTSEGINSRVLCLPFGNKPKNKVLMKGYHWNGAKVPLAATLMCGSQPAPAPTDKKLQKYRIPRVQAVELDYGFHYWMKKLEAGKEVQPFVAP